jgi:hypothetical protein
VIFGRDPETGTGSAGRTVTAALLQPGVPGALKLTYLGG